MATYSLPWCFVLCWEVCTLVNVSTKSQMLDELTLGRRIVQQCIPTLMSGDLENRMEQFSYIDRAHSSSLTRQTWLVGKVLGIAG
jgi:hypothetical protein